MCYARHSILILMMHWETQAFQTPSLAMCYKDRCQQRFNAYILCLLNLFRLRAPACKTFQIHLGCNYLFD